MYVYVCIYAYMYIYIYIYIYIYMSGGPPSKSVGVTAGPAGPARHREGSAGRRLRCLPMNGAEQKDSWRGPSAEDWFSDARRRTASGCATCVRDIGHAGTHLSAHRLNE